MSTPRGANQHISIVFRRAVMTISASHFIGDGSLLTGIGQGDRIVSGTASAIANKETGISTNVPLEVSGTVRVAGTGSEPCGSANFGASRVNPVDGSLELCRQ